MTPQAATDQLPGQQIEPTPLRRGSQLALSLAIATILSIKFTGFQFGPYWNFLHIPLVLGYEEMHSFLDDQFYQSLKRFVSLVWLGLKAVSNEQNIEQVFFTSYIVSRVLAFAAIYWFLRSAGLLSSPHAAIGLPLVAACFWLGGLSMVGDHGLFIKCFTHSEVTWGPLIAALVAGQHGRYRLAAVFTGITFLINAFVGIWLVLIMIAPLISSNWKKGSINELIRFGAIFLLTSAPVVIWIAISVFSAGQYQKFDYGEYIRTYYPSHFYLESNSAYSIRSLSIILLCGVASSLLIRASVYWITILISLLLLLVFGSILPHVIDNRFIFNLHFVRSAGVLQFLCILLCFAAILQGIFSDRSSWATRLISCAGLVCLLPSQHEPIYLFLLLVCISLLCAERISPKLKFCRRIGKKSIHLISIGSAAIIIACLVFIELFYVNIGQINTLRIAGISLTIILLLLSDRLSVFRGIVPIVSQVLLSAILIMTLGARDSEASHQASREPEGLREVMDHVIQNRITGPFLFPVDKKHGKGFNEFQLITKSTVWVDWKQGAAVMWSPEFYWQWFPRYKDVLNLGNSSDFANYAKMYKIQFFIIPAILGDCTSLARPIYRNDNYSICQISSESP